MTKKQLDDLFYFDDALDLLIKKSTEKPVLGHHVRIGKHTYNTRRMLVLAKTGHWPTGDLQQRTRKPKRPERLKNIYYSKKTKRYTVVLRAHKRNMYVGSYATEALAVAARNEAIAKWELWQ